MTVHHDSGQRTLERRGYSSRPVGSCGTICTSVTTDASKITCRRRACAKYAAKVEQPRRIALVIARPGSAYPTTDTHCCGCPSLEQDELGSSCRVASIFGWESNITSRRLDAARRLPECRAAEVRS